MVVAPLSTRDWKLLEPKFCRHRSHVPPPVMGARVDRRHMQPASIYSPAKHMPFRPPGDAMGKAIESSSRDSDNSLGTGP